MIDPYGINVDFSTIKRIMEIPKTEILFNFMYNFLSRFLTNEPNTENINKLYGSTKWQELRHFKEQIKEDSLVGLYREQLKKFSNYVYQYRLSFSEQDKTYYYLFHLTQNIDGCSIMKDAFAEVNYGNVEFLGPRQPNPNQASLFDKSGLAVDTLINMIFDKYKGKQVAYEDIVVEYIDSTPYLLKQIKQALEKMKNSHLQVIQKKQNTRTFQNGYVFEFFNESKRIEIFIQQPLF